MPNSLTATGLTQLASAMVAGLYDGGTLVNTIYRDAETDLVVGKGDSVTVREPQTIAASNFGGTATVSNIDEGKIVVAMSHQPYSQVMLTAKERTLAIESMATQVVMPQVAGVVEYVDTAIATLLNTTTGTADGADVEKAIAAARATLTTNKVPLSGRWLAVAPDVASAVLTSNLLTQGNIAGAATALADGIVGRILGFTVVETPFLAEGEAVAYHTTAVAGVFRTPVAPQGAASGSASLRGLNAQLIYGYDNTKLSDVLTCHTLFGLGTSNKTFAKRAVKVSITAP